MNSRSSGGGILSGLPHKGCLSFRAWNDRGGRLRIWLCHGSCTVRVKSLEWRIKGRCTVRVKSLEWRIEDR
jgi:hypothetical protein